MQVPISIFIICQDEEKIIDKCLSQAAKLASEIIIVDSGSQDRTLEIARTYTDKIYQQEWQGYSKQKNYALSLCSNEWVLSLDADEVLSDELIEEIKSLPLIVGPTKATTVSLDYPGYQIARKLFIGDKFIRWGGYYPDYQLRLFKKSLARFCSSSVHESVELHNPVTKEFSKDRSFCPKLKNPLDHYSYESLYEMEKAFVNFAKLSQKKSNPALALLRAVFTFLNKFFVQLGLLHGFLGFRLALIHSQYTYNKYLSAV